MASPPSELMQSIIQEASRVDDKDQIVVDVAEFLGISDYHDFELVQDNESNSICIYRAKSVNGDKEVIIKVAMSPNLEDNATLEEEFRILTALKQQHSTSAPHVSSVRSRRKSGSFIRTRQLSGSKLPTWSSPQSTAEDLTSGPAFSPFPTIIEKKRVYGEQCVALVFESFPGSSLRDLLSANDVKRREDSSKSNSPSTKPIDATAKALPRISIAEDSMDLISDGNENTIEFSLSINSKQSIKEIETPEATSLDQLTYIFWQVADVLDWLHRTKSAYQALCPENIFVRKVHGKPYPQVQLSEFGFAAKFDKLGLFNEYLNEKYMSPEQTGRTERITDYRTDMYSLGVIMWEAFAGKHPFEDSNEPSDHIYAHVAKVMSDPRILNPDIPEQIVSIIEKLVQKSPEDRYHLASAVKFDLQEIMGRFSVIRTERMIPNSMPIPIDAIKASFNDWVWSPGAKDYSPYLQFRSKMYGRKEQLQKALDAFDDWEQKNIEARNGCFIIISGEFGAGKAALAEKLCLHASERGAFPITSKPSNMASETPYLAFRSILDQLVAFLLSESEENLMVWEEKLIAELGIDRLKTLISFVPSFGDVIRTVNFREENSVPSDIEQLFTCLQKFLSLFGTAENPILLCIGEFNGDSEYLSLIKYLLSTPLAKTCIFVGLTYATDGIAKISELDEWLIEINLPPVNMDEVLDMLGEVITPRQTEIHSLAALLLQKSTGNLLFLIEIIKFCEKSDLIKFDQSQLLWVWDVKKIEAEVGISSNAVSIMTKQIDLLDSRTKEYLHFAACIGFEFDAKLLAKISGGTMLRVNTIMSTAIASGYIQPLLTGARNVNIEFPQSAASLASANRNQIVDFFQKSYQFTHRSIYEYLKNGVKLGDSERISLQIAHELLVNLKDEVDYSYELSDQILAHYEIALPIITDESDLYQLAELQYKSGLRIGTTSTEQSQKLLENALINLEKISNLRIEHRNLKFKINAAISVIYIRIGELERAETILKCMENDIGDSEFHKLQWVSLNIQVCVAKNQIDQAVQIGAKSNCAMNSLFSNPEFFNSVNALKKFQELIPVNFKSNEDLLARQGKSDLVTVAETMIQNCLHICQSKYDYVNSAYFSIMGARLTILEGITENSSQYFAQCTQLFLGSIFNYMDIKFAKNLGQIALLSLSSGWNDKKICTLESLLHGYTIFWSFYEANEKISFLFNNSLSEKNMNKTIRCMIKFHQLSFLPYGKTLGTIRDFDRKVYTNSLASPVDIQSWQVTFRACEDFASGTIIKNFERLDCFQGKFIFYMQLMQAMVYSHGTKDYYCSKIEEVLGDLRSTWIYVDAILCNVIFICEEYYENTSFWSDDEKTQKLAIVDKHIEIITTYGMAQISGEHRFKIALAKAEKEKTVGNIKGAIEKYEEALEGAQSSGNILFSAWINELYGSFWVINNSKRLTKTFLLQSLSLWEQWGADAKTDDFMARFPEYFPKRGSSSSSGGLKRHSVISISTMKSQRRGHFPSPSEDEERDLSSPKTVGARKGTALDVDINTFLKVTNSITNEKDLDVLVDKILGHLMSNTGATKAVILFNDKGVLEIQRVLTASGNEAFQKSEPQLSAPMALINYTFRTQEPQVFADSTKDSAFSGDPYIESFQPKSVLCCPIKHHNLVTGAVYLENKIQPGVFNNSRLSLVKSLMASASIAIANAHLRKKNMELSQALQESGKDKETNVFNVETPMQKVIESMKSIKERFDPNDPINRTLDAVLSTLTSDGLFAANLGEANDKDGKVIDQDTKNWIESSLLMTTKAQKRTRRNSTSNQSIQSDQLILEEGLRVSSNARISFPPNAINLELIQQQLYLSNDPSFDCFRLHEVSEGKPLSHLSSYLLRKYRLNETFRLNQHIVDQFFQKVESSYNKLPYHNSIHSTDVLQTVEMILFDNPNLMKNLTELEIFSIIIASAIHDLDHPGINNNFLVQLNHPMAILYNDTSVLESHHIARAFDIASNSKYNIFETMSPDQYRQSRKMIISIVLATDLAQHFQFISKFKGKVVSSTLNLEDDGDRHLIMQMAVKCGDLGNPVKSFEQAKKWTNLVMEEFFRQGDREKLLGLPVSKFMDRNDTNVSKCQIGFIDFLVAPLFDTWTSFSKTDFTDLCIRNINYNRTQWQLLADSPNILPGVSASDYETLDNLLDINMSNISFGKHTETTAIRRKMDSIGHSRSRKFSVGKASSFVISEGDNSKAPFRPAISPTSQPQRQLPSL